MSDITWGKRNPGSAAMTIDDDPTALVIGEPDWVRLPEQLGGFQVRVLTIGHGRCVVHGDEHVCKHYALEGGYWCCECTKSQQFYWYRAPKKEVV